MNAAIWIAAAWAVVAVISAATSLGIGWMVATDPVTTTVRAAHQDAVALARRDRAASEVCDGQPFEWIDESVLVCHREAQP